MAEWVGVGLSAGLKVHDHAVKHQNNYKIVEKIFPKNQNYF